MDFGILKQPYIQGRPFLAICYSDLDIEFDYPNGRYAKCVIFCADQPDCLMNSDGVIEQAV